MRNGYETRQNLFLMFLYTWRCTTFNSIPNISILLTNKNVPLIYSITFCQQKTKDCAPSASKLQFSFLFFLSLPPFITPSPLHNFFWNKQRRRQVRTSKKDLDQGMAVQGRIHAVFAFNVYRCSWFFFISIILHDKQERLWTLVAYQDVDRQQALKIFWEFFFADLKVTIYLFPSFY